LATAKDAQATGWTLVILATPAERLADMVWSGKATKAAPIVTQRRSESSGFS
jgi:hypothetical protein